MIKKIVFKLSLAFAMFLALIGGALAFDKQSKANDPKNSNLLITKNFSSADVNSKAWICKLTKGRERSVYFILHDFESNFLKNKNAGEITIGKAYKHPEAWVYIPMINKTKDLKNLIVNIIHDRCDTVTAYLYYNGSKRLTYLGQVYRRLPINKRKIPLRSFAFPFGINAKDTVALLLNTKRVTGIHELRVNITDDKTYITKNFTDNYIKFSLLSISIFLVFVLLSLGVIFKNKLLLYSALYASSVIIGQCNFLYFFDDFGYPDFIYLTANSIGVLIVYLGNAFMYPFSIAYVKNVYKIEKWHRYTIRSLSLFAALGILLLLFAPLTSFINVLVTNLSLILTTLSIVWLFYVACLGAIHKKERHLLITVSFLFLPLLFKTYITEVVVLNYGIFQSVYLIVLLGYLTVSLFKRELSSKALTAQKVRAVELQLENVRKTEIHALGRNLHDQLGNTLASALGYLNLKRPNIVAANKMIFNAIDQVRLLSHNLVKNDERTLNEKLENLIETFNDFSSIAFDYKDYSDLKINELNSLKQDSIYMIVQEALNNIIKHSHATEATIQVFSSNNILRLTIEDDGAGYNTDQNNLGIGLINMEKRASIANLNLAMESGFGGTMIAIETDLAE